MDISCNFMLHVCVQQDMFREDHPYEIIPVELNDVVFTMHALTIVTITTLQVFIYEVGTCLYMRWVHVYMYEMGTCLYMRWVHVYM